MSTETLTHAKTEHQPISWAIASGHCPLINSTVRPPLEMVGKLIGIHASLKYAGSAGPAAAALELPMHLRAEFLANMRTGALIGVARLVGVVREPRSQDEWRFGTRFWRALGRGPIAEPLSEPDSARIRPWWRGPYGWLWSNEPGDEPLQLREPIPMRGQKGLWRISDVPVKWPEGFAETRDSLTAAEWALEQWRKARKSCST